MTGLANDLNIKDAGIVAHNGSGVFFGRTLIPGAGISITNADGIAGNPTISASGFGVVDTITGDSGATVSGAINLLANTGSAFCGSSVRFNGVSATEMDLVIEDSHANVLIGGGAGNATLSGGSNTSLGGLTLMSLTNGNSNTAIGYNSAPLITSGSFNSSLGGASLSNVNTGIRNTAIGVGSLTLITSGSYNIAIGDSSAAGLSGTASNNIIIGNHAALPAQNNIIVIGEQGTGNYQQNQCYIAGITGVSVAGSIVLCSTSGQLGTSNAIISTWTDVTGATQTLVVGNGYATDRGGGVTYTLPATAAFGDEIKIVGKLGLTTIAQNANQAIRFGSSITTTGVGGSATGTNVGDCVSLRCITGGTSTIWIAESFVGNFTIV